MKIGFDDSVLRNPPPTNTFTNKPAAKPDGVTKNHIGQPDPGSMNVNQIPGGGIVGPVGDDGKKVI